MVEETTTTAKKTTRTRRSVINIASSDATLSPTISVKKTNGIMEGFIDITKRIVESKEEFERLQKEISETKEFWVKEQRDHETQIRLQREEEELGRKREKELYEYETGLARKKAEDAFAQKQTEWEQSLKQEQDLIKKEREELTLLRKQVADFEEEKAKAVNEALNTLKKDLQENFDHERKLREQEVKAQEELLALKIQNITADNSRQTKEIEELKKALDETTKQIKEIAVKVIEAGNKTTPSQPSETKGTTS